jgi:ATP-dependent DNA helicase RecG
MLKSELLEIIANRENSGVEFKRDDIRPEKLAKEVVALANFQGGKILLGVEDDGTISGIQRDNIEEWVMNIFREKVHPMILPFYEEIQVNDKTRVAVISFPQGISKPYVLRHNGREEMYIRVGTTSRIATREQQMRLFESGGMFHVEMLPVAGTSLASLDLDRLNYYLESIIKDPEIPKNKAEWSDRLLGLGLMAEDGLGNRVCSIAGLICFGIHPRRYMKQAGLRVMAFPTVDKDYQALLDTVLDAPLVGRWKIMESGQKELLDEGLIEKFSVIIEPFITREAEKIDAHMRREKTCFYPREAVRETVINALAHRDWTKSVDIEITNYLDRLEVISPGKLPNTMSIEKMIAGQRSPRNTLIMEVLRDYGYVDSRGMGVRTKIIPLMKKMNGIEPIFEATEDYLKTILPRKRFTQ